MKNVPQGHVGSHMKDMKGSGSPVSFFLYQEMTAGNTQDAHTIRYANLQKNKLKYLSKNT
jgi:hypothetical protein